MKLPQLENRDARAMLAHVHSVGGLLKFFEQTGAPGGDWGELLFLSPPVMAAVLLEEAARDCPPEGGRPHRLALLAEEEGAALEDMAALFTAEIQWQQKYRPLLENLPELIAPETASVEWYKKAALRLGAGRLNLFRRAEAVWRAATENPRGLLPPHLGQLMAFLDALESLRPAQNQFVRAYTEHFYRNVIGAKPHEPAPDEVLVCFQAEEEAPFATVPANAAVSTGEGLVFRLADDCPVSAARLAALMAIRPAAKGGPFAWARNLAPDDLALSGPLFAEGAGELASAATSLTVPGLSLPGGRRQVNITVELGGEEARWNELRWAWNTRPDDWLSLEMAGETLEDVAIDLEFSPEPRLSFRFTVPPGGACSPELRLIPRPVESPWWQALAALPVEGISLAASVSGFAEFDLVADGQPLANNPDEAVAIFGPQPGPGAAIEVKAPSAGGARVERLSLNWEAGEPESFARYFRAYPFKPVSLTGAARTAEGWQPLSLSIPWEGGALCQLSADMPPEAEALRFSLPDIDDPFGHRAYGRLLAQATLRESSAWRRVWAYLRGKQPRLADLNPPFTPAFRGLTMDYSVSAHYGPEALGHVHPWASFRNEARASLLPHYDCPILAFGLEGLNPGEGARPLSLYAQLQNLAPASSQAAPVWRGAEVGRDDTGGFRRGGLFTLTVKPEAEDEVSWLNLTWPGPPPALAISALHLHAAWAVFDIEGWQAKGEIPRPWPLPPASLSACKGYKATVTQPYPSVGGRPRGQTGSADFWREEAELLSHRGQAVLPRDYERLVLREFPEVMSVECLPHTDDALRRNHPGHTAVRVFAPQPSARVNPNLPSQADDALLAAIQKFLAERASPLATIHCVSSQEPLPGLRAQPAPCSAVPEPKSFSEILEEMLASCRAYSGAVWDVDGPEHDPGKTLLELLALALAELSNSRHQALADPRLFADESAFGHNLTAADFWAQPVSGAELAKHIAARFGFSRAWVVPDGRGGGELLVEFPPDINEAEERARLLKLANRRLARFQGLGQPRLHAREWQGKPSAEILARNHLADRTIVADLMAARPKIAAPPVPVVRPAKESPPLLHRGFPACYNLDAEAGSGHWNGKTAQFHAWLMLYDQLLGDAASIAQNPGRFFQPKPLSAATFVADIRHPLVHTLECEEYQKGLEYIAKKERAGAAEEFLRYLASLLGEEPWWPMEYFEGGDDFLKWLAAWVWRLPWLNGRRLERAFRPAGRLDDGGATLAERIAWLIGPLFGPPPTFPFVKVLDYVELGAARPFDLAILLSDNVPHRFRAGLKGLIEGHVPAHLMAGIYFVPPPHETRVKRLLRRPLDAAHDLWARRYEDILSILGELETHDSQ